MASLNNQKQRVLITGGAGFIGANLIRKLLAEGSFEIVVIEKEGVNLWRLEEVKDKIQIIYVDLEDAEAVKGAIAKTEPDVVFHLASYGVHASFETDVRKMLKANVEGTLNLAEALQNHTLSHFVYTSTSLEYKEKDGKLVETDTQEPVSFYGATKLASEMLLSQFAKEHNLPVVNVRLFTAYGYYEDKAKLMPSIILNALQDKPIELSSPGNVRDFIFIEDAIEAFLNIVQSDKQYKGEMFNIGSGQQHSIAEVVEAVEKALGKQLQVQYGKENYYKEPKAFIADITKAKHTFNWEPQHNFAAGIVKSVAWYQANQYLYSV